MIKQKFDIKFSEIVKEEKNDKIKNFIQLKKIEMQQELLKGEMDSILGDMKPGEINDPQFNEIIKSIEDKTKASVDLAEKEKKALESKEEKVLGFDIDKAKEMAEKGDVYLWNDSKLKDYKFEKGDKINYFSSKMKKSNEADVIEDLGERIKIRTKNSEDKEIEIEINRLTIISSENFDKKES